MRISVRLPLLVVVSSILAAGAVGFFSYQNSSKELHRAAQSELVALREDRHAAITQYFRFILEDLELMASSNEIIDAVREFTVAFGGFDQSHRSEFEKNLRWVFHPDNIAGDRGRLRQVGEQQFFDYSDVHDRYHPWFELALKLRGYYDIFLITPRGDIVYSVVKEPDFATNLYRGEWRETDLARVLNMAVNSPNSEESFFVDFRPYAPSNDDPAAFIGRRIIHKGRLIGVIALQMPIGRINEVMQVTAGMGETGETYLVGPDSLMRSDSRFSKTSTILTQKVATPAVEEALAGKAGVRIIDDYRGVPVLSAYQPLSFQDVRWAILSEKDMAEIGAPTHEMRETAIYVGLIVCLGVGVFGALIAYSMTTPLFQLSKSFQRFGQTRTPGEIPYVNAKNEIGELARSFNEVTTDIGTYIANNKQAEQNLGEQRKVLKDVLENTVQAVVAVDQKHDLIVCNSRFQKLLQLPDELIVPGTSTRAMVQHAAEIGFYGEGDTQELVETRMKALTSGKSLSVEIETSDGLIWYATLLPNPDGGFVMTYTDITERKLSEREVEEKNNLLEDLSAKLSRYLSPQVYDSIFSGEQDVTISTDRKKLTVFFSDIKDFTATTEDLEPEELTFLLNDYLTKMTEIALEYGATIDKYIGDAMLLFFGDPDTMGDQEDALACVKMAIAMQRRMVDMRAKWMDFGHARPIHMRIGINTGYCNVGNFGSEARMDYTIIGGEVNLAARLEGISEPNGIMLAHETYALVKHEIDAEEQEPIKVKGISRDVVPYAVSGIFDDLDADRPYIRSENDAMRLYVDLRKLDKKGRTATAKELEKCIARLREI